MIPMPPTRSEIDATVASSSAMMRLLPSHDFCDLTQIADWRSRSCRLDLM